MGDWVGGQGLLLDRSLAQVVDPQGQSYLGWVSKTGGPIVIMSIVAAIKSLVVITSPRVKVKVKEEIMLSGE